MRNLSGILILKMAATAVLWFIPLLLFPVGWLKQMGLPLDEPALFLRLLGVAYGSLLVNYGFGLSKALRREYPRATVWTGIVSNGGAFLILAWAALHGTWAAWGFWARMVMWVSLVVTGLITAGLAAFGPCARHEPSENKT